MKRISYLVMLLFISFLLSGCSDYTLIQINANTPGLTFCEYVVLEIKTADNRLLVNKGDTICISCTDQGICPGPNAGETFEVKGFDTKMTLSRINSACSTCSHLFAFKVE